MVMCNSLCGVKVNIMEVRPLVEIGRKVTDRIRYRHILYSYYAITLKLIKLSLLIIDDFNALLSSRLCSSWLK